jgi:hypothetical protein
MLKETIRILKSFPNIVSAKSLNDLTFLDPNSTYNTIKSMDTIVYKKQYGNDFVNDLLFALKNFRYSVTSFELLQKYNVTKVTKEKITQVNTKLLEDMILDKNWDSDDLSIEYVEDLITSYNSLYTDVNNMLKESNCTVFSSIPNKRIVRDLLRVSIDLQQLLD